MAVARRVDGVDVSRGLSRSRLKAHSGTLSECFQKSFDFDRLMPEVWFTLSRNVGSLSQNLGPRTAQEVRDALAPRSSKLE
jgi:hypothetical protein